MVQQRYQKLGTGNERTEWLSRVSGVGIELLVGSTVPAEMVAEVVGENLLATG